MDVLVPGEGTIFSTCTLWEGNTPCTLNILGANGVIVRQEWVMPNKAWRLQTSSSSTIRSLLFLAYSNGAEAQSSIRGEAALLPPPTQPMEIQTWFLIYLPPPQLVHSYHQYIHINYCCQSLSQVLNRVPLYYYRVTLSEMQTNMKKCARTPLSFLPWVGHVQARKAKKLN